MQENKLARLFKIIIFFILINSIVFLGLEIIQRVRWYFKSDGSVFWLMYGFVRTPNNFDEQIARIAAKKKLKDKSGHIRINEISIWEKEFPNGIKKHNPDAPEHKGQINSLGFRSHEFNPKKENSIYRVITLGGSTTAGYESDIDHTWPALLEKKLNSRMSERKKFEVINTGKGEVGMAYVIGIFEKELIYYDPDMALLYLTFNHLHLWRASVNVQNDFSYKICRFKNWLSSKSLFFLTLREKLTLLFRLEGQLTGDIYIPTRNSKSLAKAFLNTPEVFLSYRKGLEDFVRICKKHNIVPVLISEACVLKGGYYLILGKDMDMVYTKMYAVMEDVAKKDGAIFVDAAREIKEVPNHETFFTDGLHLNPEGNDALAEVIYGPLSKVIKEDKNYKNASLMMIRQNK